MVIGTVLGAPLITPVMGIANNLTMGMADHALQSDRLGRSMHCHCGRRKLLLSEILLTAVDIETKTQTATRSTPTLVELIIAVAAAGAGSYALSRPDVSSPLPGVTARATSLEPDESMLTGECPDSFAELRSIEAVLAAG